MPETHCPTCGYDVTGLPEPRCPECGEPFDVADLVDLAEEVAQRRERNRIIVQLVAVPLAIFFLFTMEDAFLHGASVSWLLPVMLGCMLINGLLLALAMVRRRGGNVVVNIFLFFLLLIAAMTIQFFVLYAPILLFKLLG